MFLINSRLSLVTAASLGFRRKALHLMEAPLLPKLRGYFAEFLLDGSLERLRILSSPTCVGLRYSDCNVCLEAISWRLASASWPEGRSSHLTVREWIYLLPGYVLDLGNPCPSRLSPPRHPITPLQPYRNINLFPISYAFRPRLRG